MQKFSGSCVCGETKYRVEGEIRTVVNCHCNFCRKMNGAAFSTYVVVAEENFELLHGEFNVNQVSEQSTKSTCRGCNTPIFNSNPRLAGLKILHFGSVDDAGSIRPQLNIYCESKCDWLNELDSMKSLNQGVS